MRTTTIPIYKFNELPRAAKDRAKHDYGALHGYVSSGEAFKSLTELAKHFGGTLANYWVDFFATSHSSATFDMGELPQKEVKRRLDLLGSYNKTTLKGNGDCKLTGYCLDEDAIDGFRIAYMRDSERDLNALMQAAFTTWLNACQSDCASFYEDENFADHATANDMEFYEDGEAAR